MKMCSTHQHNLVAALRGRGLDRFIATTGEALKARTALWLLGKCKPQDMDSLGIATCEIYAKAVLHLPFMSNEASVLACPMCEVGRAFGDKMIDEWYANCTEMIYELFETNNLVARRPRGIIVQPRLH